jgi:hypothetical protein
MADQWQTDEQRSIAANQQVNTYQLVRFERNGESLVRWDCPNGKSYFLNPRPATIGNPVLERDGEDVMMSFSRSDGADGEDGILCLSLVGANSYAATLLHEEDDRPARHYFCVDSGNHRFNLTRRRALILRSQGVKGCPVEKDQKLRVMTVRQFAPELPPPSTPPTLPRIERGFAPKTTETLDVYFSAAFPSAPIVVVSPYMQGGTQEGQHIETIVNINTDKFTLISGNYAPGYRVAWMAIEQQ